MKDQIRIYLENLFRAAPQTRRAKEMQEELLANLYAKYDDLINQGRTEQDAYNITIGGIGDINELLKDIENDKIYNYSRKEKEKQRSAILVSFSVALYIIAVAAVILCGIIGEQINNSLLEEIGVVIMFIIAAGATGLLVYNGMSKTKYTKSDDSTVEQYKEKVTTNDNNKQIYHSLVATLWPLTVVVYFLVSMFLGWWAFSWNIFILAAAIQSLIKLIFLNKSGNATNKQKMSAVSGILWPSIVVVYFVISFMTDAWYCTWLVFIIGVAIQALLKVIFSEVNDNER